MSLAGTALLIISGSVTLLGLAAVITKGRFFMFIRVTIMSVWYYYCLLTPDQNSFIAYVCVDALMTLLGFNSLDEDDMMTVTAGRTLVSALLVGWSLLYFAAFQAVR